VIALLLAGCTIRDATTDAHRTTASIPPTTTSPPPPAAPSAPAAAPAPPPAPIATGDIAALRDSFQALSTTLAGTVGVAVAGVASNDVATLGEWSDGVAWSTIKVPLAISALRDAGAGANTYAASTIEQSDNAAAEQLWSLLGPPTQAAQAVQAVLREGGDTTTQVQSQRIRAGFTAFGQTHWSMTQQALFTAHLPCLPTAAGVIQLMNNIAPGQQWGLARVNGAASKSGWGPDENGAYLVRQLAVIPTPSGQTAVTIATEPDGGTFEAGIALVDQLTTWLTQHLDQLPSGHCSG
jgi:hypothetical protein